MGLWALVKIKDGMEVQGPLLVGLNVGVKVGEAPEDAATLVVVKGVGIEGPLGSRARCGVLVVAHAVAEVGEGEDVGLLLSVGRGIMLR